MVLTILDVCGEKKAVHQNEVKYPYFIEIESKIFILA